MKELIKKLDKRILGGALTKRYCSFLQREWAAQFDHFKDYSYVNRYQKDNGSLITKLCDKYGSDKGEIYQSDKPYSWTAHTYTDFYSRLFDHCRMHISNVFECGIGTNNAQLTSSMTASGKPGASLRVWREYFPNANVYGADIDKNILFEKDRIQTFYVDQTKAETIKEMWSFIGNIRFDLMIDDGLHTFDGGVCLFENSIDILRDNGIYIIEDVDLETLIKLKKYFDDKLYLVDYISLFRPFVRLADNNLVVIRKKGS